MKKIWVVPLLAVMLFSSCKERYSEGEKVGNLIEFTRKGVIWDSWEGRLNMTQTGMNTSGEPFSFSFDKIKYHEVWGFLNIFANRGETDYFVDDVYVIDKDFANAAKRFMGERSGQVIDTIYVVIDKNEVRQQIQNK